METSIDTLYVGPRYEFGKALMRMEMAF
jgi:hypothetical protein